MFIARRHPSPFCADLILKLKLYKHLTPTEPGIRLSSIHGHAFQIRSRYVDNLQILISRRLVINAIFRIKLHFDLDEVTTSKHIATRRNALESSLFLKEFE